jgi:hypothetical protein
VPNPQDTVTDEPNNDTDVTFYGDIVPLFRPMDVQCMRSPNPSFKSGPVLLLNYAWMKIPANAQNVLDHLTGDSPPQMPYGGPYWSQDNIDLFKRWMQGGFMEGQQDS